MASESINQLVVAGCSMVADYISHKNEVSDWGRITQRTSDGTPVEWEVQEPWDTIDITMAKELGNSPINIAVPGSSNERIFKDTVNYLYANHERMDRLVVCWTTFNRYDIELKEKNGHGNHFTTLHPLNYNKDDDRNLVRIGHEKLCAVWTALQDAGSLWPERDIRDFFFWNRIIRDLCFMHDIKLYQCSSIAAIYTNDPSLDEMNTYKAFINHDDYDILADTYYGWPIYKMVDGCCLFSDWGPKYIISKDDTHPTKLAHDKAAAKMLQHIKERDNEHYN